MTSTERKVRKLNQDIRNAETRQARIARMAAEGRIHQDEADRLIESWTRLIDGMTARLNREICFGRLG